MYLELFKNPLLLRLWLGQVLSAIGDRFFEIAIVWIAAETQGAGAGFVLATAVFSRLIFGLIGGIYADLWHKQRLMIASDLIRAIALFSIPIVAIFSDISIWQLIIVAIIEGASSAFFIPAMQASLPILATDSKTLQSLNALMDVSTRVARIIGPGLAGLILAFLPIIQFFTLDGFSFAISALIIFSLGHKHKWRVKVSKQISRTNPIAELKTALVLLRRKPHILYSLIANGFTNTVWSMAMIVGLALFAKNNLSGSAATYGLILSAYGVGNVVSNIIVGQLEIRNRPRFLFWGYITLGFGILALAFASNLAMAAIAAALAAIGGPMGDLMLLMMIQEEFPANAIAKIYSFRMTLASAGYSLGLVLAAVYFSLIPVSLGIAICGLAYFLVGFLGALKYRKFVIKL